MHDEQPRPKIGFSRNKARYILKGIGFKEPPVILSDVVNSLKESENLKVKAWNLGNKVSGVLAIEGKSSYIGYNINQHQHRQRFTVAHEIGHLVLGHSRHSSNKSDSIEVEANNFAAELLMPLQTLKENYFSLKDVKVLARKFFVSEEAMWRRLMECKLIK